MEILISFEDVQLTLGSSSIVNKLIENTYCSNCHITTINNFECFLNDFNDVLLKGYCIKCNDQISRYIETGESVDSAGIANLINTIIKKYRGI